MKTILRHYLIFLLSLYVSSLVLPGIFYGGNWRILFQAALILALVDVIVRPLVSLITLPINILTLGLFSFILNGFMLYLVSFILPGFKVQDFYFPAVNFIFVRFDSFHVGQVLSYIIMASLVSNVRNFLFWLCSK